MVEGHCVYKDYAAHQHKDFYRVFEKFLAEIKPSTIIEIGTAHGGTIVAIRDIMNHIDRRCYIRSYDVLEYPWFNDIRKKRIDIKIENIFTELYDDISPAYVDEIRDLIHSKGTTLVLCDGGRKVVEFNTLSNLLKPGDFIMAHDYAVDNDYFESNIKGKIWDWLEIDEKDIIDAINRNNLKPYMTEEFQSIVWTCRVKE